MKFQGVLANRKEVGEFTFDYYALEEAQMPKLSIVPDDGNVNFIVTLEAEGLGAELLEASFKDGMLNHWGWSKKIKKI